MIPNLIATASITCADISTLVDEARSHRDLTDIEKQEIVSMYQVNLTEAVGIECDWDAKAD